MSALEHSESLTGLGDCSGQSEQRKSRTKGSDWVTNGHGVFIDICEPAESQLADCLWLVCMPKGK